jgi:hypothetical protein
MKKKSPQKVKAAPTGEGVVKGSDGQSYFRIRKTR